MSGKILKSGSLISLIIMILAAALLTNHFRSAQAQAGEFDFAGWVWSENYGWISLNSDNCLLLDPTDCLATDPRVDYSVKIDSGNNITGYGWSENVGWVCFGNSGSDPALGCAGNAPPGGWSTTLDEASGRITGWAKVVNLGDAGWVKLGRGEFVGANFGEACYDCQPKCEEWTIELQGDPPVPVAVEPCLAYSETDFDSCNTCFSRTKFDGVNEPDPAVEAAIGGSGYICRACSNCRLAEGVGGASRIVCNPDNGAGGQCNSCELYGVNRNAADAGLLGWGWNGDGSGGQEGVGWLQFNTEYSNGYIVFPWLQTLYGSIYTPGQVRQRAGVGGQNATYCIFAQDINTNIKTQSCENFARGLVTGVETGFLQKSPTKDIYRNALGKIDIQGLVSPVAGGKNKYGQPVNELAGGDWKGPSGSLNNSVYYFSGDLTVGNIVLANGAAGLVGNGLIIVDGNLNISGNLSYENTIPTNLAELASVAWIVRGDIIVAPEVESAVGAFIAIGNGGATCEPIAGSDQNYPRYNANRCGGFFSGDSNRQLTVLGMVIARAFDLGRTYSAILQGAERIVYDGRLTVNTPPGLEGFVEGLPVIRDFSY